MIRSLLILLIAFVLAGCEELGIPDPQKVAEAAAAEGRAIGSACRYSGRALEDCYALNPSASKASIFEGWRSMNDYMTENKIEVVLPTLSAASAPVDERGASAAEQASEDDAAVSEEADGDKPERPRRSRTLRSLQDR